MNRYTLKMIVEKEYKRHSVYTDLLFKTEKELEQEIQKVMKEYKQRGYRIVDITFDHERF